MEAPPLERKLVAILAADVEGYSRMMHEDEEATLATLSSHRAIIDDLITAGRGQISGTAGDSVIAEFASVIDAVHCAVAIQQALHKANASLSVDRRMRLRIGINVGDVMVKEGDIFGDGVNVAARLETLAEPGGICVTRGVRDHVRDRLAYTFEDHGEHAIKNIARPVRVFRLVFDPNGVTDLFATEASEKPQASGIGTGTESADADTPEVTFWQSVQAGDDPAEYQAYLDRYPEGLFADLARARLEVMAHEVAPKEDPAIELAFWDTVKDSDNVAMFEAYLAKYPNGAFASLARIRLAELRA